MVRIVALLALLSCASPMEQQLDVIRNPEGEPAARAQAAAELAKLGPEVVDPLVESLQDEDPRVREYAAYALLITATHHDAKRAGPYLVRAARDPSANVRIHANRALWFATVPRDPAAIDALLAGLEDERYEVRHAAAHQMGWRHVERAVPQLIKLLDDPEPYVRGGARASLKEIGTPEALSALKKDSKP